MGNVMSLYENKIHLLNQQYRCDPKIIAFSNKRFYGSRIINSVTVKRYQKECSVEHPLLFIDIKKGKERRERSSYKNEFEANAICHLLLNDNDIKKVRDENNCATTMIITPYKAQRELLTKIINENWKLSTLANLRVATVDSFQGQEGDIVVFSTVS